MQKYTIHGARMTDREEAHIEIAQALQLPPHYGKNLDALYDCLTDISEETEIELLTEEETFLPLKKVLTAATKSNKNLNIK